MLEKWVLGIHAPDCPMDTFCPSNQIFAFFFRDLIRVFLVSLDTNLLLLLGGREGILHEYREEGSYSQYFFIPKENGIFYYFLSSRDWTNAQAISFPGW